MDNIVPIDKETGEIIEDGYVIFTTEQLAEYRKKKDEEKLRAAKIKEEYKKYGNFVWIIYNVGQLLFDGKITGTTLTKVIYLSTFIRYSNSKDKNIFKNNKLEWIGLMSDNHVPIKKSNLSKILGISEKSTSHFLKETTENNILFMDKDFIYLNAKYISKGKITEPREDRIEIYSRIYIDAIRKLYRESKTSMHKILSYLFLMIPFLNLEWNVLCYNQKEKDMDSIKQMSLNEFCSIMGYSKANISLLVKRLLALKINDKFVVSITLFGKDAYVFINPRVFYAGNNHKEILKIAEFTCPDKDYNIKKSNKNNKSKAIHKTFPQ